MISSGVLAFYLSETEDPELWRAMAQLTQDERTDFFKSALSYLLIEEGQIPPGDYTGTGYDQRTTQNLFATSSQMDSEEQPYDESAFRVGQESDGLYENSGYGTEQAYGTTDYRRDEGHQDIPSMREWYEETQGSADRSNQWEVRGTRHTLTPTFSQPHSQPKPKSQTHEQTFALAQAQLMSHQARLRQLFAESVTSQASSSNKPSSAKTSSPKTGLTKAAPNQTNSAKESQPVTPPEIKDVVLEDIYSNESAPGQDLRGLDFLLKNVIGEETDEAVLNAIRRKRHP
ncbi:MAG: hypothetical protein FWG40_07535 [Peptococcaceae bacterium]|nr:hypothetical protein [Peptococcaceae bacterium]